MKISFKYCIAVLFALIYSKAWTQPAISFGNSGNPIGCAPHTIVFNISGFSGNVSTTTYTVNFGDGSPILNYTQANLPTTISHTYTQISCGQVFNGNQNAFGATITATNASGSTIGTVTPIRISKKPNAAFNVSPSIICSGGSITFTNTSETGVTYTGNTCNTNPPFYWQVTGPSAGSVTSGSLGTNNGFANNIAAWTAGTSSLTMQFTTPGSYQMKLAIGNSCGIDDTTISFTVGAGINIDDIQSCQGSVAVLGAGMTLTDSVTSFAWTGPSGFSSTQQYPIVNNPQPGTYTLTVQAPGCGSASATLTLSTTSTNCPNAAFTSNVALICSGNSVNFTNQSPPGGLSYYWFFGDGGTASSFNTSHVYTAPQGTSITNYTATLVVVNAEGVMDVQQSTIQVQQIPPEPEITSNQLQLYNGQEYLVKCTDNPTGTIFVSGLANNPGAWAQSFTLNWGDGSPLINPASFATTQNHIYLPGLYSFTVNMLGPNGCSIANTYPVFVGNTPAVNLGSPGNTERCSPYTFNFPILDVGNNEVGTTYVVTFSDGGSQQTFNHPPPAFVSHTFTESSCGQTSLSNLPDAFWVQITAQNPCDVAVSTIEPIRISMPPVAQFTALPDPVCINSTVSVNSTADPGTNVSFTGCNTNHGMVWSISPATGWTITSGALGSVNGQPTNYAAWTSGSAQLQLSFSQPGDYAFTQRIRNSCGEDIKTQSFTVLNGILPDAGNNLTLCFNADPITLTGTPAGGTWSGTGVNASGLFTPSNAGTFDLTYSYTSGTCTLSDVKTITVSPELSVSVPNYSLCAGASTTLTAIVSGGTTPYTYNWSPNGSLSSINGATAIAQPSVSTTYELTATDANGCIANDSASVTVVTLPLVNAGPDISLCYSNSATALSGFSPAGGTWSGIGVSASGQFTPSTLGTNTLTYSVTQNNCTATDAIVVEVIALPGVNAGPDLFLCISDIPFTLSGGLPAGGNWSGIYVNNNVLSTNINASSILTYTYTENGCIGTDQISVSISDTINVQAGSDFEMCVGDSILLNGSPAGGYWAGAEGLNASGLFVPLNQQVVLLSYVISNTNCPTAADVMVLVADTPSVTFNLPGAVFCTADTDVPLSGGLPEGGTYSGEAIANNRMNPSLLNPGNYVVTYDYTAASGCTARDTALIRIEACTGMSPSNSTPFFRVFPNPGKGMFHIEVAELNAPAQLFVYNSSGVLVSTKNMDKRSTILDMSLQAPGIYFMRIEANGSFVAQQKMLVLE